MLAIGTPAAAFAQDDPTEAQFQDLTAQASAAYDAGDNEKAVTLFKRAYELRPVSNILYNIARIYEESGQIDEAIEYYDKFVVAPNVEKTARRDALDRLKTLREVRELKEGDTATADATEDPQPEPQPQPQPAPDPGLSAGQTVGWVFIGVGGASLIGSGIFALLAQSEFNEFEEATSLQDRRQSASQGRTNSIVADTLLVTGAVSAIVGTVFLVTSSGGSDTNPETARNFTVSPLLGGDVLGLGLELDF